MIEFLNFQEMLERFNSQRIPNFSIQFLLFDGFSKDLLKSALPNDLHNPVVVQVLLHMNQGLVYEALVRANLKLIEISFSFERLQLVFNYVRDLQNFLNLFRNATFLFLRILYCN